MFIYAVAWAEFPSFLRLDNTLPYVYIPHLFAHLSFSGHLGCFHLLVVSNVVMRMGVQISPWTLAFNSFGSIPRSGIAGSCANSIFFLLFLKCSCPFLAEGNGESTALLTHFHLVLELFMNHNQPWFLLLPSLCVHGHIQVLSRTSVGDSHLVPWPRGSKKHTHCHW